MDGGTELVRVRRELDVLASARTIGPLSEADEARYDELARRERTLLRIEGGDDNRATRNAAWRVIGRAPDVIR